MATSSHGVLPGNIPLMTTGVKHDDSREAPPATRRAKQQDESDDAGDAEHPRDDGIGQLAGDAGEDVAHAVQRGLARHERHRLEEARERRQNSCGRRRGAVIARPGAHADQHVDADPRVAPMAGHEPRPPEDAVGGMAAHVGFEPEVGDPERRPASKRPSPTAAKIRPISMPSAGCGWRRAPRRPGSRRRRTSRRGSAPSRSPRPALRLTLARTAPSTINAGMMTDARTPDQPARRRDGGVLTVAGRLAPRAGDREVDRLARRPRLPRCGSCTPGDRAAVPPRRAVRRRRTGARSWRRRR